MFYSEVCNDRCKRFLLSFLQSEKCLHICHNNKTDYTSNVFEHSIYIYSFWQMHKQCIQKSRNSVIKRPYATSHFLLSIYDKAQKFVDIYYKGYYVLEYADS